MKTMFSHFIRKKKFHWKKWQFFSYQFCIFFNQIFIFLYFFFKSWYEKYFLIVYVCRSSTVLLLFRSSIYCCINEDLLQIQYSAVDQHLHGAGWGGQSTSEAMCEAWNTHGGLRLQPDTVRTLRRIIFVKHFSIISSEYFRIFFWPIFFS